MEIEREERNGSGYQEKQEFEYYDFMSDYRSPWVFNKILQKP